jgi:hypothetical protein
MTIADEQCEMQRLCPEQAALCTIKGRTSPRSGARLIEIQRKLWSAGNHAIVTLWVTRVAFCTQLLTAGTANYLAISMVSAEGLEPSTP